MATKQRARRGARKTATSRPARTNNRNKRRDAGGTALAGPPICGVIMPISAIDNCSESHWLDVRSVLFEAIEAAGFEPRLVSDADDVGIIQKRIIQNVYENPVVVCDVSGKNPNVMFELGLRLAFDKPTVIVKDDKTTYSFDTAPIEHVQYPRDLRFGQIVEFKQTLADKVIGTYNKATSDAAYTTFLKHFGAFTVAKLETKSVSTDELLLDEIRSLRRLVLRREDAGELESPVRRSSERVLCFFDSLVKTPRIAQTLGPLVKCGIRLEQKDPRHFHVHFLTSGSLPKTEILRACAPLAASVRFMVGND